MHRHGIESDVPIKATRTVNNNIRRPEPNKPMLNGHQTHQIIAPVPHTQIIHTPGQHQPITIAQPSIAYVFIKQKTQHKNSFQLHYRATGRLDVSAAGWYVHANIEWNASSATRRHRAGI